MNNIIDYLDWRGDVTFEQSPLNEVDNYILCKLGCPDYTGLVPRHGGVKLGECVQKYFAERGEKADKLGLMTSAFLLPMLRKLPETARFRDLVIRDFVSRLDPERGEQFSALTIELPGGVRFVTFRGTDDTLVAWKEDFMLGVSAIVPAQQDALDYLEEEAAEFEGDLITGGHSKGGNLAVYAALRARPSTQDRVIAIYNNDGPGFAECPFDEPQYRRIKPRLHTILSQHAIVGTLLWNEPDCEIVRSDRPFLAAHDGFHWEVRGTKFVRCDSFSVASRAFANAMEEIEGEMDMDERREFIESLFSVLESTGAVTLTELTEQGTRQALLMAQTLCKNPRVRAVISKLLSLMLRETVSGVKIPAKEYFHRLTRREEKVEG